MANVKEQEHRGIYAVANTVSGKSYIGSSENISHRFSKHYSYLNRGVHINKHLQAAWRKYGPSAFVFEVLEATPSGIDLRAREQRWLDMCSGMLYNMTPLAERMSSAHRWTIEERKRQSERRKGTRVSEATKEKLRRANLGKKASAETKAKMSAAMKGRKMSLTHRAKLSARPRGPMPAHVKALLLAANKGRPLSLPHRLKLSAISKGKIRSKKATIQ
jgi:group I intron endonuclease